MKLLCAVLLLAAPVFASDAGPVAGLLGSTLGAGAATGAERAAWGGNPAALRPGSAGVLLHGHRPFGMGELAVLQASAFKDWRRVGGALLWNQIAVEDLYRENAFELRAAWRWGKLDLGGAWSLERREIAGHGSAMAFSQGFGAVWRPLPRLAAGFSARELPLGGGMVRDWEDQGAVVQAGLEGCSGPCESGEAGAQGVQVLRFDLRKTGAADWRTLAAWSLKPHPAVEITAGLASAPFQFSLGVRAAYRMGDGWAGWAFHHALRHHRHLGSGRLTSLGFTTLPGD